MRSRASRARERCNDRGVAWRLHNDLNLSHFVSGFNLCKLETSESDAKGASSKLEEELEALWKSITEIGEKPHAAATKASGSNDAELAELQKQIHTLVNERGAKDVAFTELRNQHGVRKAACEDEKAGACSRRA